MANSSWGDIRFGSKGARNRVILTPDQRTAIPAEADAMREKDPEISKAAICMALAEKYGVSSRYIRNFIG